MAPTGPQAYQSGVSGGQQHMNGVPGNGYAYYQDPFGKNPYEHRADEIGPCHNVPGVVHLGGLLAPPEWKEGDEPLSPLAARRVFESSRHAAKQMLESSTEEAKRLPLEERNKFEAEKNQKWVTGYTLDTFLLNERITVYEQYHARKEADVERDTKQLLSRPQPILRPPEPVNPPTKTTIAMAAKPAFYYSPTLNVQPNRVSGMYPINTQPGEQFEIFQHMFPELSPTHVVGASFSSSSSGNMNPSFLDPMLQQQQIVDSGYRQHHIGTAGSQQQNITMSWNGFVPQRTLPPLSGPRARPFYGSSRNEYNSDPNFQQSRLVPRPPQYVSPTHTRFDGPNNTTGYAGFTQTQFLPAPPGSQQWGVPGPFFPAAQMNQPYAWNLPHGTQATNHESPSDARNMRQLSNGNGPVHVMANGSENNDTTKPSANESNERERKIFSAKAKCKFPI